MAIQNASDLLVYRKYPNGQKQVTRIKVKTASPLDGTGVIKVRNAVASNGSNISSQDVTVTGNTGASVLSAIATKLSTNSYTSSADVVEGDFTYRDFTNPVKGICLTISFDSDTATIDSGAIIINVETEGQDDADNTPVAHSTSANFSISQDSRDITTKDSGGFQENAPGLRSFEITTDALQDYSSDLDFKDFFDNVGSREAVEVAFSDRIRNILTNKTVVAGQDGFALNTAAETTGQGDPFSGTTASFIMASATSESRLQCNLSASRLEDKKLTWSFYVKQGSASIATIQILNVSRDDYTPRVIDGNGALETLSSSYYKITGLNGNWTRIAVEFKNAIDVSTSVTQIEFRLYPGVYNSQTAASTSIYTSSWQFEQKQSVTDYQDPTTVTNYRGNAFVSSLNIDAGVEDNTTYSVTFTGTSTIT